MDNNDELICWNEGAGAKWVAKQMRLNRLFAPLTQALLSAAAPKPGELAYDTG